MPKKATRQRASNAYTCSSGLSARAKQFVAELQQLAPNKDRLVAEFRAWCVRREHGDTDAAYVLEALLQLGLKPEQTIGHDNSDGTSPFTILQFCLFSPLLLQQIITTCNLTSADLNRKQPGGSTLLHTVCMYTMLAAKKTRAARKKEVVESLLSSCKLLLDRGADPDIADSSGLSLMDTARRAAALAENDRVVELVIMIGERTSGGWKDAQAIRRVLKHPPSTLISKLTRLAAGATPLIVHTGAADANNSTAAAASVTAVPGRLAEGVAAASSGCGLSNAAWGFKQLPDNEREQAGLLLWAAECKLATFNQALQLIPLACIPDLAADIAAAVSNIASFNATFHESESGDREAGSEALDKDLVTEWLTALNANPWQLGLYAMANSIRQLQNTLCSSPRTLSSAAEGIKALIAYAQHLTVQNNSSNATTSSKSTDQVFSLPSKKAVPEFVKIADSVANLVSWTIVAHGNVRAEDNQILLSPLVEAGYHKDLLTLLGMGYLQAGRGLAAITWIPTAAVDTLELLAANNGDNVFTRQMTMAIRQIIKAGNKGRTVESKHLQEALWCAECIMQCSFMLSVSVHYTYYYSDRAAIPPLLCKAMPLIATLHSTPLAAALSAAADLTLNQLHYHPGASTEQVKVMTDDWRLFNRVSRQATQGLDFATGVVANSAGNNSSGNCNETSTGTCCDSSSNSSDSHGGAEAANSRSRQADWGGDEQDDPSLPNYLYRGIERCHESLIFEVCQEMGVKWSDLLSEVTTTCGMVEACRTQQLAAGFDPLMGRMLSRIHHPQLFHLAKQAGDTSAALESDRSQRRAAKRDPYCWNCGRSAEEAVAAGRLSLPSVSGSERANLLTCSKCKVAKYCCANCQRSHWKQGHKQECTVVPIGECISPEELVASERASVRQRVDELTRSLKTDFVAIAESEFDLNIGPARTD